MHVYRRSESMIKIDDGNESAAHSESPARGALVATSNDIATATTATGAVGMRGNCSCTRGGVCSCCRHLVVRKLHLDDMVCVDLAYVPQDLGFKTSISVDGRVYFSKEISVTETLPLCFEVPYLRDYASLCLKIYDFEHHAGNVSACIEIEARLYHILVARKRLGCIRVPI